MLATTSSNPSGPPASFTCLRMLRVNGLQVVAVAVHVQNSVPPPMSRVFQPNTAP